MQLPYTLCIGEINLTTKIITLSELFSFVSEFSRLQYEWSSDCWCIWKWFWVNACLQWRKYFHFIGEVFLYFFFSNLSRLFWLHMRVSSSISIRRDRIRTLLSLCPGCSCAQRRLDKIALLFRYMYNVCRDRDRDRGEPCHGKMLALGDLFIDFCLFFAFPTRHSR
jgi:hypothetical protein